MKYAEKPRTRQTFTLTGLEHRGARAGNERMTCFVQEGGGHLVLWGTFGRDMRHINELEARVAASGYPVTIECDWIPPDGYEVTHFGHRYWVWETDHFVIR
jgi:hypothetical protein